MRRAGKTEIRERLLHIRGRFRVHHYHHHHNHHHHNHHHHHNIVLSFAAFERNLGFSIFFSSSKAKKCPCTYLLIASRSFRFSAVRSYLSGKRLEGLMMEFTTDSASSSHSPKKFRFEVYAHVLFSAGKKGKRGFQGGISKENRGICGIKGVLPCFLPSSSNWGRWKGGEPTTAESFSSLMKNAHSLRQSHFVITSKDTSIGNYLTQAANVHSTQQNEYVTY